MAGLATAIGLGGKLSASTTGIPQIIDQTGDAISGNISAAGQGVGQAMQAENTRRSMLQKDGPKAIETDLLAGEKQRDEFSQFVYEKNNEVENAYNLYTEGKLSRSTYEKIKTDAISQIKNRKTDYESDFKALTEDLAKVNRDEWSVEDADRALMGYEKKKTVNVPVGQGESQKPQIGTEIEVVPGYFDLSYEQQKKLYPQGLKELAAKKKPIGASFSEAYKDFFGTTDMGAFIEETNVQNEDGTASQTFRIKEKEIEDALNQFLASKNTNLSKDARKYFRSIETVAREEGEKAGYEGKQLETFVDLQSDRIAAEDFYRGIEQAKLNRTKDIKKDNNPDGKGFEVNFSSGGGGKIKKISFGIVENSSPAVLTQPKAEEAAAYRSKKYAELNNLKLLMEKRFPGNKEMQDYYKKIENNIELTAKYIEKMPANEGYVTFSSQDNTVDSQLDLTDGSKLFAIKPTVLFKKDGEIYVGGIMEERVTEGKKTITRQVPKALPLNNDNIKTLNTNKPGFEEMLKGLKSEKGFFAEKPSEKKKETKKPQGGYKIGQVVSGYEYTGGDPTKQENWKQVKK
jgi:hypothetical protein